MTTRDWQHYIENLARKRSDRSTATRNMLMATFRNVLKVAQDDGLIDVVPATPVGRRDRIGSSAQSVAQSPNRPWSALHDAEVQKDVRG